MTSSPVGTYLRFLRKQSGLTQRQLAQVLGTVTRNQVSRHERSVAAPSLIAALGYQSVFREPISDIFPGLYHTVAAGVEELLEELEIELGKSTIKGRAALPIARRLEWLAERRTPENN